MTCMLQDKENSLKRETLPNVLVSGGDMWPWS